MFAYSEDLSGQSVESYETKEIIVRILKRSVVSERKLQVLLLKDSLDYMKF